MSDLFFAIRRLASRPWLTITAMVTIALAIGANTAILSIADAVLFRPLPYADPDRLFVLEMQDRQTGRRFTSMSLPLIDAIAGASGIQDVTRYESGSALMVSAVDGVAALRTVRVSDNSFPVLGVTALHGRLFARGEAREPYATRAVVLTYSTWQRYFGGSDDIVGRTVSLSGAAYDVVGVLPADFVFPSSLARADVVLLDTGGNPDQATFHPAVRIAADRTREQVQAAIDAIAAGRPDSKRGTLMPTLVDPRSVLFLVGRPLMLFMLLASAALLAIGCTNISSMLAVATKQRERETGVRLALGVSRARLVRQSLLEGGLIGVAGALIAIVATRFSFELLLDAVPPGAYGAARVGVDARVAAISLAVGVASALLFSAVPTWHASRVDAVDLLRGTTDARRTRRFGHPAIVVQVAAALVLAFGGIVASKSLIALLDVPLGFEPQQVVTIGVRPAGLERAALRDFYVRTVEQIRGQPDVAAVGAVSIAPFSGAGMDEGLFLRGEPVRSAGAVYVLPGYFETVGIRLVRGNFPTAADVVRGAAVVSETGARALLDANRDPIGQFVERNNGTLVPVVGVVSDVIYRIGSAEQPAAYLTLGDTPRSVTVMAKLRSRNPATLSDLHRLVSTVAPTSPVAINWWSSTISATSTFRTPRFQTLVLGSFATLSLVLTAVGVYGLVSFLTARRKREIGVRLAIGARPVTVTRLFVSQMMVPLAMGIAVGVMAIWWLTRIAASQLTGVQPDDPAAAGLAIVTVLASALLAAYVPARRASRLDPVVTLRQE